MYKSDLSFFVNL